VQSKGHSRSVQASQTQERYAVRLDLEDIMKKLAIGISCTRIQAGNDPAKPTRRNFLHVLAGSAAASAASRIAWAQSSASATPAVRAATGLLATWQSIAWLGTETGLFKKYKIDMTLPAIAVGGPQAATGLLRGDWEFAHTGALPVAEEVLKGRDIVILSTPTSEFPNSFVMTRKEITDLSQLGGKKVGGSQRLDRPVWLRVSLSRKPGPPRLTCHWSSS